MSLENTFLLENARWPALLLDGGGVILHLSAGARELFGGSIQNKLLGTAVWAKENELSPGEFLARGAKKTQPREVRLRSQDGKTSTYIARVCNVTQGSRSLYLMELLDGLSTPQEGPGATPSPVEEERPRSPGSENSVLEASLAHKQKLDCALQLSRTVALDFNNALTSILGHTSHILARLDAKHPLRSSLVEIEKSAERAAEIASDLAAFSRQEKDAQAQQSGNLNDLIRRTVEAVKGGQNENIQWSLQLEKRLYTAKFEEAKMQQALLKILENSIQAISQTGTITIRTRNIDATENFKDNQIRLAPGNYVQLEVADTGSGISPENLPRVFEPFFTTKKEKGHRGLGLAWVYGIVTNHGGSVAISSEAGKGASVRVYLPAQKKIVRDESSPSDDLSGSQTILMIDDEDLLLTMGEMVLSSYGYTVLTANAGKKGLEIFTERANEIDLVITDLVMPQMSGRELIDHIRRIDPSVRIICASGFVRPPSMHEDEHYLQKPFASQDLLRKVKQVLMEGTNKI